MDNPQYDITGEWMATDDSGELEVARTSRPGIIALRSPLAPDQFLPVRAGKLRDALHALETKAEFRELVST